MTAVDTRPIFNIFKTWLEERVNEKVGDIYKPADVLPNHAWVVMHEIPTSIFHGNPLVNPQEGMGLVFQLDAVGRTADQVRFLADKIRRTMTSRTLSGALQVASPDISPFKVMDRASLGYPGVKHGGEPENRVYYVPERYVIHVTPN